MVLSFETFFNGRVEKQRQAQRDSWLLFSLFYCCGLAFVSFEHVRFMFNIFWAHFCASRPIVYAPRSFECVFGISSDKQN